MKNLLKKNGINESNEQFENWLQEKITQRKVKLQNFRTSVDPYVIHVVVHVIHNGQTLGTGPNVSDARILSQIEVLNKDFNRLNTDAVNTPAEFQSVAGSMNIEFILDGIVRVNGGEATWNPDTEDSQLKSKSYWPSDTYLNLWVTDLSGAYIGYAQFPFSTLVGGLTENKPELTDGVVIDYTAFGVGSSDPSFNLGRTATHEVAHFLGLRHIWGDDNDCTGDEDYVNDTPSQLNETTGCPQHPQEECSTNKMFQNYLDYSDDDCMNLFTIGQVDRMITVLENSPRRASLLNPPCITSDAEDLRITAILSPAPVTCSESNLKFNIQNNSSPAINSFKVDVSINNATPNTTEFVNGVQIVPCESFEVSIPISLPEGVKSVYIKVHSPNGVVDATPNDSDTLFYTVVNNSQDNIPLRETFNNNSLNLWSVANPQNGILWNVDQSLARVSTQTGITGEKSWLVSPIFDFQNISEASLFFTTDPLSGVSSNRLKILSSIDCGASYQSLPPFESSTGDKKYISLSSLAGESDVRIAFVATNDLGDNIDVDNIEFFISDDKYPVDPDTKPFAIYWQTGNNQDDTFTNANITFNLTEKQDVGLVVTTYMGQEIVRQNLPNMLNQTLLIPVGLTSKGLYIVRLQIGKKYYTTKIYLSP